VDCPEFRERVELLALDALPDGERTAAASHAAACPSCRALLDEYARLAEAVRRADGDDGPPPPFFAKGLEAALRREIRSARRHRALRRLLWGGAGAGLAAALLAGIWTAALEEKPAAGPPREEWRIERALAEPVSAAGALVARGNRLYVVGAPEAGRRIRALEAGSGRTVWISPLAALGYLAADEVRVYGLAEGKDRGLDLFALEATEGRLLWRCPGEELRGRTVPGPALPLPGNRLAWSVGRSLLVLEADTGRVVRKHSRPGAGGFSNPVLEGGRVYAAHPSALLGVDPSSGEIVEDLPLAADGPAAGRPLVAAARGFVFVAWPAPGRLAGIDLKARRPAWTRPVSRPRHLLADGSRLYVRGDRVLALDAATGATIWTREAEGCGPITAEGDLLRLVDTRGGGRLVALDRRDGRGILEIPGVRSCDAFVREGPRGFLKTNDGVVHALVF